MRPDWLRAATDAIRRNDHRNILAAAAAVGLAIVATYVTGTFHPPAGINPLLVISNNLHGHFWRRPYWRARCC
jgi:CBS-domain-containing membrane protein